MSDPHNAPMPTKAAGQEWPFPPSHLKPPSGGSGGLTEGTTSSATTEAAEHAAPAKRGRGRPKGPPTAKKLHVCLDAPSWQSLQMVADVLRVRLCSRPCRMPTHATRRSASSWRVTCLRP